MARICITMGDPAGIGPEIILKAVAALADAPDAPRLVIAGSRSVFDEAARSLGLRPLERFAQVSLIEVGAPAAPIALGATSAEAGRLAYLAVAAAVRATQAGEVDAIVTAPLSKEGLHLAGQPYPGHTELLADLTGTKGPVMMLAHENFRVSHVTTHIPLDSVSGRATPERLRRVVDLTHQTLIDLGIARPRIAVAALNPHAGEGGILGRHDIDVSAPVIADYQARGMALDGPVPGDTVFVKMRGGHYDAVIAMYHDQGHIPVKLLGFSIDPATGKWEALSGVNITLGLPIVRTSVDHGTAFDIAGRGIASERSLLEAIDYAVRLARTRADAAARSA
jgi:4-hydroxythreonine-4-phosphate dehydrogenase